MRDNLDFIARSAPGLKYIQVDDGYQPAMGDWLETGAAFECVTVPLFNLVYHDAIITPYRTGDMQNILYGLLIGGLPQVGDLKTDLDKNLALIRQMAALHERLALIEMTKHEFLDKNYRKERTTFADGTTVTVDWDANAFEISPELKPSR